MRGSARAETHDPWSDERSIRRGRTRRRDLPGHRRRVIQCSRGVRRPLHEIAELVVVFKGGIAGGYVGKLTEADKQVLSKVFPEAETGANMDKLQETDVIAPEVGAIVQDIKEGKAPKNIDIEIAKRALEDTKRQAIAAMSSLGTYPYLQNEKDLLTAIPTMEEVAGKIDKATHILRGGAWWLKEEWEKLTKEEQEKLNIIIKYHKQMLMIEGMHKKFLDRFDELK